MGKQAGLSGAESTPEQVFDGSPEGLKICSAVQRLIARHLQATVRTTASQVAFRHRRGFAYVWNPRRYLKTKVPAVLSIALPRRLESGRFKEIVNPSPGIWMHHLELGAVSEVDDEVAGWLAEAFAAAA
ncbi:DUF5655 domain-containing protein [Pseudarthrobacter sp. NPDC058329]|uniref:DUF5655 domain-containing protein n=1 Tax=Pseudarthrobacter sp. NPDC058329 TaxID=3346448 RepID=UPI0036DF0D16